MTRRTITSQMGYTKRLNEESQRRPMVLEVQGISERSGDFFFNEEKAAFEIRPNRFMGVVVRISAQSESAQLKPLEENSITLTLKQAHELVDYIQGEIAFLNKQLAELS